MEYGAARLHCTKTHSITHPPSITHTHTHVFSHSYIHIPNIKPLRFAIYTYNIKRVKSYQRARRGGLYWLVASHSPFLVCVSLSMIFQASRFSASGRRVPLEPRRSEACRSCQPMHVLSFGEGRSRSFWFPVRVRQPAFGKCEPASWWSLV